MVLVTDRKIDTMLIQIDTTQDPFATALAALCTAYKQPIPSSLRHITNREEAEAGVLAVAPDKQVGEATIEDVEVAARMIGEMTDRRPWVNRVLHELAQHGRADLRELADEEGSSFRGVSRGLSPLSHAGGDRKWAGLPIVWTENNSLATIQPGLRAALAKALGYDDLLRSVEDDGQEVVSGE